MIGWLALLSPLALFVGYLETFVAGGTVCELGELIGMLDSPLTSFVEGIFCSVGSLIGVMCGFLAGVLVVEVLGVALALVVSRLLYERRKDCGG